MRYKAAAERFQRALSKISEDLVIFGGLAFLTLFLSAAGIYYFKHEAQPEVFASIPHSFWWAAVTLTIVGYGDAYPVTMGGRIFTFFVLIVGLGVVAVPVGLIASALTEVRREGKEALQAKARSAQVDLKGGRSSSKQGPA